MDFFSKQRFIAWAIVILIVLNLGTLATLWIRQLQQPSPISRPELGPPARARDFLSRELGFSEDQKKELADLQARQVSQMDALQGKIDALKRGMMDQLLNSSSDSRRIEHLAGEVGEIEARKARLVYTHLGEIKDLCTPEQRERFAGLVRELLRIMKPPNPSGHPGDRPDGRFPPPGGNRPSRPGSGAL